MFKEYILRDLIKIKNGKNYSELNTQGKTPVYGTGGLMGYTNSSGLFNGEAILLPRKGSLTNIMYVDEDFWTVDTMYYALIKSKEVDAYYLYNYLKLLDLSRLDSGSGVPSMTFDSYYDLKISLPNIDTQRNIAEVIRHLNDKITQNNNIIVELENTTRLIYDYFFSQFDFPDTNENPYKSSGGKMAYSKEFKREIPEGWKVVKLGSLLRKIKRDSLPVDSKEILKKGRFPVVTQDAGEFISGYTNKENPIEEIPVIVFGDHSCTLRYIDFPFLQGADGTQLMYFDKELVNYIYTYLHKILPQIPGYGKYERHYKYVKDFNVLVPDKTILRQFESTTTPMFTQISVKNRENNALIELRNWLMPLLATGRLHVATN